MTFLDWVRYTNIVLAVLSLALNLDKMIRFKLWEIIDKDALYRWMALYGLLLAYIVSTNLAISAGVPVGLWTLVWTPPMIWAVISGFSGRKTLKQTRKR